MSSSTDLTVDGESVVTVVRPRDLRVGDWTRLGPDSLLGDSVSEHTLSVVAEQARAAARAQGYSVGWAQGRREAAEEARVAAEAEAERLASAEAQRDAEHQSALDALTTAAKELTATLAAVTARVETQATDLAWALTEELVGHQVRGTTGAEIVRRVLALAPVRDVARVHLHPRHLRDEAVTELADNGVRCVADPSLEAADALVEIDDHVLDLRVSKAMERVREVLS